MSRRRERGVALVAAAVALAILSVLASGLATTSAIDQRLARSALASLQADALARSGVAVAAVLLRETGVGGGPDTLRAPWAAPSGRQPLGAGWVEVTIEDEARRLDVNERPEALPGLLRALGLDPHLAEAIRDWTDGDDAPRPGGAERDWYLGLSPPYVARNGPLATVGELRLVRGVDAAALARLRPFVTAAGEPRVNPNTAPREVLLALGAEPAEVESLLALRAERAIGRGDFPAPLRERLTVRGRYYTARALAGVGEIRRSAEATLDAPAGADPRVVAWRPVPPEV